LGQKGLVMTFFPVVERELRVASRQSRTYWSRALWAGAALFVAGWVWIEAGSYTQSAVISQRIYWILASIAFLYTWFAGVGATSDSISEEKREGTLGLLFLTDLRGLDIILGKLASSSLRTVFGLVAIFPILAIPLLLGGLTIGEFFRMGLFLLTHLFFCLGLGMLCSTLLKDERSSLGFAMLMALGYAVLPSLVGVAKFATTVNQLPKAYFVLSPIFGFVTTSDAMYARNSGDFAACVAAMGAMGAACFGLSAWILPHVWRQSVAGARLSRTQSRWKIWKLGDPAQRRSFRAKLLDINPIYWLGSRDRLRPHTLLLVLAFMAAGWGIGLLKVGPSWIGQESFTMFGIMAHVFLKVWFAIEAPRMMLNARQSGALELVLTTPISVGDFIQGALRSFRRDFGRGFLLLVVVEFAAIILLVANSKRAVDEEWVGWAVLMMAVQALDLVTIAFLGLWRGLKCKSLRGASTRILVEVVAAPWLVVFLVLTVASVGAGFRFSSFWVFLILQLAVFFIVDILHIIVAGDGLTTHFREKAANRFDKTSGAG